MKAKITPIRTASAAAAALILVGNANAALVISATAPATNVLSSLTGSTNSNIFPEPGTSPAAGNANHARGQIFSLGAGGGLGFSLTSITIQKNTAQTFAGGETMTLYFYEGTEAQLGLGTGHSTPDDGGNFYVDTAVTPLYSEVFTLGAGAIANGDFVTFEFASPIAANESSDFGFFITYDPINATPDRFGYSEGATGGRISVTTTDHGTTSTRNVHYYVQGIAAVPEPSSALLVSLAGLALFKRRRK